MSIRPGEWLVVMGSLAIVAFAGTVGYFIYQKPPPVEFVYVESPLSQKGEMIFRSESCYSCHEVFGNGASYGPSLDGVGSRRSDAWLQDYLLTPRSGVSKKPYRLKMPSYASLPPSERDALVAYLGGLRQADGTRQSSQSHTMVQGG